MTSASAQSGQDVRSSLRVEVITQLEPLEDLRQEWSGLLPRSPGSTAFSAPGAVIPWFRSVRSHSKIHVATVWRQDELVGLAPFSVMRLGSFRLYCSAGTGFGFFGGPLLGSEPKLVAAALGEHLGEIVRRGTAAVHLRRVLVADPLLGELMDRDDVKCIAMGTDETTSVVRFDLMEDPEDYFARAARKHQISRRSRRLAEHVGTLETHIDDPEPEVALDVLRDMLKRRLGQDPRIFRDAHLRSLTREIVRELATDGHGSTSTIFADGRRISIAWNLRAGPRMHGYAFAYEPEFRRFSIGNLGYYYSLRAAYDSGIMEVDIGTLAGYTFKQQWANSIAHYRTVTVTAPGRRASLANQLRRGTIQAHRRLVQARRSGPAVI